MRNYKAPSNSLAQAILLAAASSLSGCFLFEPETHFECFNPDCSPLDSGTAGTSGTDGGDPGDAGGSSTDSGDGGGTGGDAASACQGCDPNEVCDETSGQCVQCLNNDDCEPPTSACTVDHRCVACTLDRHCPSSAPACTDDNTCAGCTDSELHCGGDTPLCDVAANECVQCLADTDCTDPTASRCSDGACEPCTGPLHCEHIEGLGVCDTSASSGECVECTGTQYGTCGTDSVSGEPFVCDSAARACTQSAAGSALACEPCVSDAHCRPGTACMHTSFGGTETGAYCLWMQEATGTGAPNGDCLNLRPYVGTESSWQSVDGQTPTVCKPARTTCEAQNHFLNKSCSGDTPSGHAECGVQGVDDGFCAPFGADQRRCTVPCVSYDDCKETRPGDDMECRQQTLGTDDVFVCQFE